MRISRVKAHNYRNIDGIEVLLNPECNYIIGENNLGKSNFLAMLSTVCSGKGFDERDFFDSEKSIESSLMHLQPAPLKGLIGHSFSLVTIEFGAQSDLLCAPNFHPTISNRMTFHLPLLGSLRRRCCFQARPCLCLSADWCYIWFATWVYISSVKPALQWPSILGTVFMLVSVYSVFRTSP